LCGNLVHFMICHGRIQTTGQIKNGALQNPKELAHFLSAT
jgi:hypothetical protein